MIRTVAALWVDPRGPYPGMPGVECWGLDAKNPRRQLSILDRDARNYPGPHPVVAHPPCGAWSKIKHLSKFDEREHGIIGSQMVRRFGGVLEHPAGSELWSTVAMAFPGAGKDFFGGYTVEVCQSDWGHVARKRTWLYLVGVPRSALDALIVPPFPGREPTHYASGGRHPSSRKGSPVPPGKKVCSTQQRNRSPRDFARLLVELARASKAPRQTRRAG